MSRPRADQVFDWLTRYIAFLVKQSIYKETVGSPWQMWYPGQKLLYLGPIKFFQQGEWINQQWQTHTTEYSTGIKRNELFSSLNGMDKSETHFAKWKKSDPKSYILYDCIHTHWKRQIYMKRKEISVCQGLERCGNGWLQSRCTGAILWLTKKYIQEKLRRWQSRKFLWSLPPTDNEGGNYT